MFAFHWAGVKARTVAASPLVALGGAVDLAVEVVDQRLQCHLVRGGHVRLRLGLVGCGFGMAVVVARSASAAIREAGSTST